MTTNFISQPSQETPLADLQGVLVKVLNVSGGEIALSDGTVLAFQPVVVEVERIVGMLDQEGNPVYRAKIGISLVKKCKNYVESKE